MRVHVREKSTSAKAKRKKRSNLQGTRDAQLVPSAYADDEENEERIGVRGDEASRHRRREMQS